MLRGTSWAMVGSVLEFAKGFLLLEEEGGFSLNLCSGCPGMVSLKRLLEGGNDSKSPCTAEELQTDKLETLRA